MKTRKYLFLGLLTLSSMSLLIGCNSNNNGNITSEQQEVNKNEVLEREKEQEDFSVDIANKIIEEFEKSGDLKVAEEILNDYLKNDDYYVATKTQLLNYFIPQFNRLVQEISPFFETNYVEISNILSGEHETHDEDDEITKALHEDIQKFIDEVDAIHGKIYSDTEVGYLLTLDWQYFIDTYKENIDPYFVEILEYYRDNIEVPYRENSKEIKYNILMDKIIKGESLLEKRENDLYIDNISQLLGNYYKVFFGNYETTLFEDNNILKLDTLKVFYEVLDKHPDSELSNIVMGYLNELKQDNGSYLKNTFATVYLMEKIGGNIEYFEYNENGEYVQPDLNE